MADTMIEKLKIGIGYDIHPLTRGRKLIIGGVEIPFDLGLAGHSDGDVLCHAIADALLSAASLPDIGELFPDTEKKYKDVSSLKLLEEVKAKVEEKNYEILNVDSVIVAERPKLAPYKEEIKRKIGSVLGLEMDEIGLKAKTQEGMGEVGRGEAIACYAIALLRKKDD